MRRYLIIVLGILAGCATYHPKPISPEKTAHAFEARSLSDSNLVAFLKTNGFSGSWDLPSLTLVAFYCQPALAEARAQWAMAAAGKITAGERPNPNLGFTPTRDVTTAPPWIFGVTWDIPIETMGKRGQRIAQAKNLTEAAKWDFVSAAWQVRSRVRAALLALYAARENDSLSAEQEAAQSQVVRLLAGQFSAGSISSFAVTQARVALENTQLARQDALGQLDQARVQLAAALGLPLRALDSVDISFEDFQNFPADLTAPKTLREAVLNRADIRSALASYAASQSALQLEIAKQYPDIHLGPGYELDQTDNKWSLGLSLDLPILNHNQGGVAEAKANRAAAAAHFLTVQTNAIAEIGLAMAGYRAALRKSATAKNLLDDLQQQLQSVRAQAQAGEIDALTLANAEVEFILGKQNHMNAILQAQQAFGQLEDAVQSPLTLKPSEINAVQNQGQE